MNFELLKKYKKLTKLFYILAFVCIGILILNFVLFLNHTFGLDATMMNKVVVFSILFSPMLFAFACWFYGMIYNNRFMYHYRQVKQWRRHNIVSKIIEYELDDKHDKAVILYNSLKTSSDKDMLFTFLITNSMHSDDPKRKKSAEERFKMYRDWYKTSNVTFDNPFEKQK